MSRHLGWRLLGILAVLAGAGALVATRPARLGLDLRGGTQILLEAEPAEGRRIDRDTIDRTVEVLRRRVDQLGVTEPTLQRSGAQRIIVELPGVSDPTKALEVIGRTAQLQFHSVLGLQPATGESPTPASSDGLVLIDEDGTSVRVGPASISGDDVKTARAMFQGQGAAGWVVEVEFRGEGSRRFAEITGKAACSSPGDPQRRIAIALDTEIISSPEVSAEIACNQGISGGRTVITGQFTQREAEDLALLIRAGALPVPVEVIEQRTIGPTLGDAAIAASVEAAIIGATLTVIYIVAYYRFLGALAALALLAYGLVSYGVLLGLRATLTLPGVAGFVLAVGMAVDANVLVFERMKEERASGKTIRTAAINGFRSAWSAIADSNATTLIAALLLFWFAGGAVRGFGVTLSVGVVVSMFTAIVVTRVLVDLSLRSKRLQKADRLFGLSSVGRVRAWLQSRSFDILAHRRIWFSISVLAVAVATAGIATRGLNFGVEFTGGQLVEYDTQESASLDEIRKSVAEAGFPRALVQRSGENNIAVRTGQLSADAKNKLRAAVAGVSGGAQEVRSEFIGPTIGNELRRKAAIAVGIALLAQLAYLAVRFRWTYGTSAVAAMFHDVLILLGVFAWLEKDIDGVFLAALLTVVGYSINDSVVVFDRIREQRRSRSREPLSRVINDACIQTIPRTINTGLGALFILVALYVLGGDTLMDFAFALLIGILVGTYSSVFTAAPLTYALERPSRAGRLDAKPQRPAVRRSSERRR